MNSVSSLTSIPLEDIKLASQRIKLSAIRTPLVKLNYSESEEEYHKIYLKLENLQPINSFKIRGANNALECTQNNDLLQGVYTASAGNFAQGLAWSAAKHKIPCKIIVPENTPETKLNAIKSYGGEVIKVSYDAWWKTIMTHSYPGIEGVFLHPVSDRRVIAGNATIGLEIFEDLPEVDNIIVPYGGGGLSCGVSSAIKALNPNVKVHACEVRTAAPLSASLKADKPVVIDHTPSFVDGMGGKTVLPEMWNMAKNLIDSSIVVDLQEIVDATKLLVEKNRIVAEGASAATVAAALKDKKLIGNTVCVISGGNIDTNKLIQILQGKIPK